MEQVNRKDELGSTIDTLEKSVDVSRGKVASRRASISSNHKYSDVTSRLFSPTTASRNGRKEKFKGSSANTSPDQSSPPFKDVKFDTFMVEEAKYQEVTSVTPRVRRNSMPSSASPDVRKSISHTDLVGPTGTAKKRVSKLVRYSDAKHSVTSDGMLSKSFNQIQKISTGKDEVHNKNDVEINLKSTSILNIIESDKKEKIELRSSSRIQIIKSKISTEFIEVRNTEKNRSMSKLMKRSIKKEITPIINGVKNEKIITEDKNDMEHINENKNNNRRKLSGDNNNEDKNISKLSNSDDSVNAELNESKVVSLDGQENDNDNENGKEEKAGDWWRDEVEITDQNPISPPSPPSLPTPPRHHSSPFSSPFSSSFLRTPKTKSRTVKKDSKRNSLSLSKDSFNSDATTASVTPIIHRIPRTQEDYVMNMNVDVGDDKHGKNIVEEKGGNDEVSELNDSHNKLEKNIVGSEDKGEEEEGEGKGSEKKVKFTSSNQNQNQNQSDINDDDFSNFFISTFSSSVNSSDNEKN